MGTNLNRTLGRKVRLGRLGLPLWSLGIAAIVLTAAAGQAVGPVLSGSVTGTAGMTVEQSVLLATSENSPVGTTIANLTSNGDGAITWNDEGTSFTAAIELHVGDTPQIRLDLRNHSDADANAMLELRVPDGIDVEVEELVGSPGNIEEAQMSPNTWLLKVKEGVDHNDLLTIDVSPKDSLQPGFYSLAGRVVQIEG